MSKHNHTQVIVIEENVVKDNEETKTDKIKMVVFSGAQIHIVNTFDDPEVIWDSGSTIILAKRKSILTKI